MSTTLSVGVHEISRSPKGDRAMIVVIGEDSVTGKKTSMTRHVAVRSGNYEYVKKQVVKATTPDAKDRVVEQVEQSWEVVK